MNSSNAPTKNGTIKTEEMPSSSRLTPDTNANSSTDQSKGAIPKKKILNLATKSNSKLMKLNNNIDEMATLNCDDRKRNGYSMWVSMSNDLKKMENQEFNYSLNIPVEHDYLTKSIQLQFKNHPDSDSSTDDNELLSVSDDGCIYTYKADNVADLPHSFFNLELPMENPIERESMNSTPELDFLEMDFDPGDTPSDESKANFAEAKSDAFDPIEAKTEPVLPTPEQSSNLNATNVANNFELEFSQIIENVCVNNLASASEESEVQMPWSCTLNERTQGYAGDYREIKRHLSSKGELFSPSELPSSNLTAFHNAMYEVLLEDKPASEPQVDKIMIWTEAEACNMQVTQITASACGASAVINVLNALRIPIVQIEQIHEFVGTRYRNNTAPLAHYLISRSHAGCSHRGLITGLYKASEGRVYSRFFSMYPERVVNLHKWLGYWIKNGAVPIATLNLQKSCGVVPDSWHHQMIFGVGPKGVYLTNPLECVDARDLWPQLCSEPLLLVRREDVLRRFNQQTDFPQLVKINDVRWREINVVGQVAKIIRESRRDVRSTTTPHLKIPVEYRSGITLAIDVKSPAFSLLRQCPELPLLAPPLL